MDGVSAAASGGHILEGIAAGAITGAVVSAAVYGGVKAGRDPLVTSVVQSLQRNAIDVGAQENIGPAYNADAKHLTNVHFGYLPGVR